MDPATTLRQARLGAGLTQDDLANRAKTSASTVSAYESGTKEPRVGTWLRLLTAAGLEVKTSRWQPPANRLSLLLCAYYAERVEQDPSLIDAARRVLPKVSGHYASEWAAILDLGVATVVAVLTSPSPVLSGLKADTPFALLGLLSDEERIRLVNEAYGT